MIFKHEGLNWSCWNISSSGCLLKYLTDQHRGNLGENTLKESSNLAQRLIVVTLKYLSLKSSKFQHYAVRTPISDVGRKKPTYVITLVSLPCLGMENVAN